MDLATGVPHPVQRHQQRERQLGFPLHFARRPLCRLRIRRDKPRVPIRFHGVLDVFLYNVGTQAVTLVSANAAGFATADAQSTISVNQTSPYRVFSIDGRFVKFASRGTNLLTGIVDANTASTRKNDLFLLDTVANATRLISASATIPGSTGNDGVNVDADMSDNARFVSFASHASDAVSAFSDTNTPAAADVYIRHLPTGVNRLLSFSNADGATLKTIGAGGQSDSPVLTPPGSHVVYESLATNLASGVTDSNGARDIIYQQLQAGGQVPTQYPTVSKTFAVQGGDVEIQPNRVLAQSPAVTQLKIQHDWDIRFTDFVVSDPNATAASNYLDSPGNYMLVQAGPNGSFDTAACAASAAGDDVLIAISTASYTRANFTTVLTPAAALPVDSKYRLFVCFDNRTTPGVGYIRDVLNQRLDGNADGTPGDSFRVDFKIGPAPTVTTFATGLGTTIAENDTVSESVTQLKVTFSLGMGAGVTTTSNYLLVSDGLNDTFNTTSCAGGVVADDVAIAVNSVTYDSPSKTATLNVNGGVPLTGERYRLFACKTLTSAGAVIQLNDPLTGGFEVGGVDQFRTFITLNAQADLAVTKTAPATAAAGSQVSYSISLTNNGPNSAQSVTLSDPTPANTTLVSVTTPAGWTRTDAVPAGGTGAITFTKATVAMSETAAFTIVVKINSNTAGGTVIANTATAASTTADPAGANNASTANTTVNTSADLSVTKTAPATGTAGSNITYSITLNNTGPSDAASVSMTDTIPANTTFVSNTPVPAGWTCNSAVVCTTPSMTAGSSAVFTIVVQINSGTASGTVISNTATAASSTTDPTAANNSSTATTTVDTSADLAVTQDRAGHRNRGRQHQLLHHADQQRSQQRADRHADRSHARQYNPGVGTTPAGWTRTDVVPAGGTGTISFSRATVASLESAIFGIVVKVNSGTAGGTVIANTATAASATPDAAGANNSSTANTTVNTSADLSVTKTGPATATAGTNITYSVTVTNNGPSNAASVSLTDTVPANTTFVSNTPVPAGWTCNSAVVCTTASLPAGSSAAFTIVVKINSGTASGTVISNTASASSTTSDPAGANNSSTVNTTVNTQASLTITKTGPSTVTAGSNITYSITLANSGPSDAASVSMTDLVPANTTFVSNTPVPGGWSCNSAMVCTAAGLPAGGSAAFSLVVNVNPGTPNGTVIVNNATGASPTASGLGIRHQEHNRLQPGHVLPTRNRPAGQPDHPIPRQDRANRVDEAEGLGRANQLPDTRNLVRQCRQFGRNVHHRRHFRSLGRPHPERQRQRCFRCPRRGV